MAMKAQDWVIEIENALKYREDFAKERSWNQLELDYLNDPKGHTAIGPNLVYSMGDTLMSRLNVPDPEFVVNATHPRGVDRAPVVESVDNWLIKKLKSKREVDRAVLLCYLTGAAILKFGYDSEFGWSPYYDIGEGNNLMGMTFTQFNKKGHRIEFKNTTPGMPWMSAVHPRDIAVPWGTINLEDAPWVAHRVIRLNQHLKDDPKYKNTSNLKADMSIEDFVKSYTALGARRTRFREYRTSAVMAANTEAKYNEIWEIHDREDGRVKVVCFEHKGYLRDDVDALQAACGMPFIGGSFVTHPRSFWSTPLAYYLGQIQATQFDISKQAEKQRRINNLKFLGQKGIFDPDKLNRFISSDVGAIELVETTRDLREAVVAFPQGNPFNFMQESVANRRDARDAMGFSQNQVGEYDTSSRRTAKEAGIVQQGSQIRESKRSGVVVDLYIDAIEKLNKIVFKFWRVPRWIMVDREWVQFTGEELSGDYLYDVGLVNKRTVGKAERKVEALMLIGQLMQIPGMNPQLMFKYLSDAAGDPSFEKLLSPLMGKGSAGSQAPATSQPSVKPAGGEK